MAVRLLWLSAAALAAALAAHPAQAKLVAEWCEAAKLRALGAYERCLFGAEAAAGLESAGEPVDRCAARFLRRFAKADARSYGYCPTEADEAAVQAAAGVHVEELAAAVAGAPGARSAGCALALRALGAHAACRFTAEATGVARGSSADPDRCDAKLATKLERADARSGGACPADGGTAIRDAVAAHVGGLLDALGGPAPLCGNGIRSRNESCDLTDLGGLDCVQLGHGGGGSLACDAFCRLDASACVEGPPCDLLAQDCPIAGYGCYGYDRNRCLPAGDAGLDAPCAAATDCEAGLVCAPLFLRGGAPQCLALCDPDAPACPTERTCADWLATGVGICVGS
jgi:hypothetical protein